MDARVNAKILNTPVQSSGPTGRSGADRIYPGEIPFRGLRSKISLGRLDPCDFIENNKKCFPSQRIFIQIFNNFLFKKLEIFQIILDKAIQCFFVNLPIQVNQSVSKFSHLNQALAKNIIKNADPFHAYKNVCIGLGGINRLFELV